MPPSLAEGYCRRERQRTTDDELKPLRPHSGADRALTRAQAARRHGVSVKTIDRLRARGELAWHYVGSSRSVRIWQSDVDRLARDVVAVVLLAAVVGYLALRIACAAGVDPATDALTWLQFGHEPSCAAHHHRHHDHTRAILTASASVDAPIRRARFDPRLDENRAAAPTLADPIRAVGRARAPPMRTPAG